MARRRGPTEDQWFDDPSGEVFGQALFATAEQCGPRAAGSRPRLARTSRRAANRSFGAQTPSEPAGSSPRTFSAAAAHVTPSRARCGPTSTPRCSAPSTCPSGVSSAAIGPAGAATPPAGTTLAMYKTRSRSTAATWTVSPSCWARSRAAGMTVELYPLDCNIVRASPSSRHPSRYRPHAMRSTRPALASSRSSSNALDLAIPISVATSVGPQSGRSTEKRSRTSAAR